MRSEDGSNWPEEFTRYPLWGISDELRKSTFVNPSNNCNHISIFHRICQLCYDLENVFKVNIFHQIGEAFYFWESLTPLWFSCGGLGSDLLTSSRKFEEFLGNSSFSIQFRYYGKHEFYKHLYWYDCRNLVQHLNDRINFVEHSYNDFYKAILDAGKDKVEFEEMDSIIDETTGESFYWNSAYIEANILHGLIMNLYAILDIATKVVLELESLPCDFSNACKFKSSSKTFGNSKEIKKLEIKDTIFERCNTIHKINFLRNEIVHNGSIEALPKLHFVFKKDRLIKKVMYCPDCNEYGFTRIINRNRFYSERMTFNEEIRKTCVEFLKKLELTIDRVIETYASKQVQTGDIPDDFDK